MKVRLTIPESLKDIKLSQYQKFLKATKGTDDEIYIERKMVEILCNVPSEAINNMSLIDYQDIRDKLIVVLNEKPKFEPIITMEGNKYGFIPNLDEITVGEQADIDSQVSDQMKWHKVMAVMYRPIKKEYKGKYTIESYTSKEKPLDVSLDVALGAVFFLMSLLKDLLNCTLKYTKDQVTQDQKLLHLVESGVGIKTFMESLEGTFLNMARLAS